jgi:hypothetical protein
MERDTGARFAYYYYVLMCSINNRKVSSFVLGRRFCAPVHDGSMMRMTWLCERYEFIM